MLFRSNGYPGCCCRHDHLPAMMRFMRDPLAHKKAAEKAAFHAALN
jgi:hypothetical protein